MPGPRDDASIVELIPALRAFARTFYRNTTDADDLVQETLMKAMNAFDSFEPGTRMKSWLFTIMRNTFYTKIRVYSREAPGNADSVEDRPTSEATQEWSIRAREVGEANNRLPPEFREVLVLVGMLGVSYEEASEICGCAIGTVKSRLNRARIRVLEDLGEKSSRSAVETGRRYTNFAYEADASKSR